MNFKTSLTALILIFILVSSQGCSVIMSLRGKKDADFSILTIGQKREVVLEKFGEPKQSSTQEGVTVDIYQVQRGNAPDPGRALGHLFLDAITLGAWEIVGTPVEGLQGNSYIVTVKYDENDTLLSSSIVEGEFDKEMKRQKATKEK